MGISSKALSTHSNAENEQISFSYPRLYLQISRTSFDICHILSVHMSFIFENSIVVLIILIVQHLYHFLYIKAVQHLYHSSKCINYFFGEE